MPPPDLARKKGVGEKARADMRPRNSLVGTISRAGRLRTMSKPQSKLMTGFAPTLRKVTWASEPRYGICQDVGQMLNVREALEQWCEFLWEMRSHKRVSSVCV